MFKYKIFYIFILIILSSCTTTKTIKKEYIEYTPAVYETEESVKERKERKIQNKAKKNGYEILGVSEVISVLGNNSFLIDPPYSGVVRINNFYNPLTVDGNYLCRMYVKRNGNFSYRNALGSYKTVKNFDVISCIQDEKLEKKLIKKEEYKKQEVNVEYKNKNYFIFSTKFEPNSYDDKENDNLPNNIDDLLCKYNNKEEKCKTLKDICNQHKNVCRNKDQNY